MIICPLCEHQQEQGLECDQCGRKLASATEPGGPAETGEALEDIDRREVEGDVQIEGLAELEATAHPAVEVGLQPEIQIEPTAMDDVGSVPIDPLGELSVERYVDDAPKTPMGGATVICRYCRHSQARQRLCERCGMSLPVESIAKDRSGSPEASVRCRACGAPVTGSRCGDCGQPVPP
jgi:hypothetical protein